MGEATENGNVIKTLSDKLNGSKKKLAAHAASGGGGALAVLILLSQYPTLLPYASASDYQDTTRVVVRIETKMESIEQSTRSSEERVTNIERTINRIADKLDVVPVRTGPVVIEYRPDSTRNGIIRKGDTVWVPIQDTAATRPR